MSAYDGWTPWGWCGSDEPHDEHWFRGFNGVDHNTTDIKCRGRKAKPDTTPTPPEEPRS